MNPLYEKLDRVVPIELTEDERQLARDMMDQALGYAKLASDDPDTKVGCVVVQGDKIVAMGTNCLPPAADLSGETTSEELAQRPLKYGALIHSEREAIYHAVRNGIEIKGATMFLPWFPCGGCAQAIIASGIARLVATPPDYERRGGGDWAEGHRMAECLLQRSAVEVAFLSDFEGIT